MSYLFTPATQRALDEAAQWCSRTDSDTLDLPEVLLGLLAEAECRAALLLRSNGIDEEAVRSRWTQIASRSQLDIARLPRWSYELEASFRAAEALLIDFPHPLNLATEFVLLGISAAETECAVWLAQQGLGTSQIESEIQAIYGHPIGPRAAEPVDEVDMPNEAPPQADNSPDEGRLAATRALDAAANRAREGLRVVEDYTRFALDDRHLTELCKQLRHDLHATLSQLPVAERLAARDTQADVGTTLDTEGESFRGTPHDVASANLSRLSETLRSLEEFGKLISPHLAAQMKQLRYRIYTLERAIQFTGQPVVQLAAARLYVLIDGRGSLEEFEQLVTDLLEAGVDVLQLRDKRLADRELLLRARRLRQLTRQTGTLFVMNDRADLAVLSDADGVHVGQEELSVKDARAIVGTRRLIGVSTHSIEQARQAVLDGASYVGVGPTFPSQTKAFDAFTGLDLLRQVQDEMRLPAFAIGGVGPDNLAQVLSTGLQRVAVSSAVVNAARPGEVARAIKAQLMSVDDSDVSA